MTSEQPSRPRFSRRKERLRELRIIRLKILVMLAIGGAIIAVLLYLNLRH